MYRLHVRYSTPQHKLLIWTEKIDQDRTGLELYLAYVLGTVLHASDQTIRTVIYSYAVDLSLLANIYGSLL